MAEKEIRQFIKSFKHKYLKNLAFRKKKRLPETKSDSVIDCRMVDYLQLIFTHFTIYYLNNFNIFFPITITKHCPPRKNKHI